MIDNAKFVLDDRLGTVPVGRLYRKPPHLASGTDFAVWLVVALNCLFLLALFLGLFTLYASIGIRKGRKAFVSDGREEPLLEVIKYPINFLLFFSKSFFRQFFFLLFMVPKSQRITQSPGSVVRLTDLAVAIPNGSYRFNQPSATHVLYDIPYSEKPEMMVPKATWS